MKIAEKTDRMILKVVEMGEFSLCATNQRKRLKNKNQIHAI